MSRYTNRYYFVRRLKNGRKGEGKEFVTIGYSRVSRTSPCQRHHPDWTRTLRLVETTVRINALRSTEASLALKVLVRFQLSLRDGRWIILNG